MLSHRTEARDARIRSAYVPPAAIAQTRLRGGAAAEDNLRRAMIGKVSTASALKAAESARTGGITIKEQIKLVLSDGKKWTYEDMFKALRRKTLGDRSSVRRDVKWLYESGALDRDAKKGFAVLWSLKGLK